MTELTGKTIANTYKQLLRVGVSTNTGVSAGLTTIETGDGTDSSFQLATGSAKFTGSLVIDGATSIASGLHVDQKVCASAFYGDGSNLSGVTAVLATSICVSNALINNTLTVNGEATFNANASVSGNLNIGGTVTVAGAVSLASTLSVGGAANFASTVTVVGAALLKNNTSIGGTLKSAGAGTFAATVTVVGAAALKSNVTVGGTFDVAGNTSVGGTFMATGAATFDNNVSISGGLVVGGTVTIVGANVQAANARVCASAYHGDGSNITNISGPQISGDVSVSNIKAAGNVSIAGTLNVTGTVTIAGTNIKAVNAAVCASSYYGDGSNLTNIAASIVNNRVAGNFAVSANLSVGGTSNLTGAVSLASSLSVVGAANFASTVTVVGAAALKSNVTVGGTLDVAGNTSIGGTFMTTGAATFDSNVSVSGNVNIGGTTTIAGAVSLASTLSVGGASNFASTVTIAGAVSLASTLSVGGAAYFASTVTIAGAAHYQGGVSVAGDITASGTVNVTGDTAAGDDAAIGYTAAEGLILTGQGSTSDITLKNDADGTVFTVPTGTDDILFPDNAKAMWGADSDLQIYHDSSNTYIDDTGTGQIFIRGDANVAIKKYSSDALMADFANGGAVTLYYDKAAKFATAAGGVNITGELEADSLDIDGVAQIDGNITVGVDDTGYLVKFFGATAGSYMLWDSGYDDLYLVGDARMGIGTTDLSLFNAVGGTIALAVCGDSASTAILGNTGASMAIVNTNTTASNTAGLHFARADTDNVPNYAGASIVAQFGETQATGQYPSASLSFLTSSSQNAAPSLKMTLTAAGLLGIGVVPSHSLQVAAGADTDAMYLDVNGNFFITDGNIQITNPSGADQAALSVTQSHTSANAVYASGPIEVEANGAGTGQGAKDKIILQGVAGNVNPNGAIEYWGSNSASGAKWGMYTNAVTSADFVLAFAAASGSYASVFEAQTDLSVDFKGAVNVVGPLLVNSTSNIAAAAEIFALGNGTGIAVGYGTGSAEYRHAYMNDSDGALYFWGTANYANLSAAGAWTNASDERLKKNIIDIKYGLEDVLKIQPRSFQMKEVDGDYIGLIAQEIEKIIPEVVSGNPEEQLCLDYGSLVAVAFKAIQDQQELIKSLTARITALEG